MTVINNAIRWATTTSKFGTARAAIMIEAHITTILIETNAYLTP